MLKYIISAYAQYKIIPITIEYISRISENNMYGCLDKRFEYYIILLVAIQSEIC